MAHLNSWYVCKEPTGDGIERFARPIGDNIQLIGHCHDSEIWHCGTLIRTAPVIEAEGKNVKTRHGQSFTLVKMYGKYRQWLSDIGHAVDTKNPIYVTKNDTT